MAAHAVPNIAQSLPCKPEAGTRLPLRA